MQPTTHSGTSAKFVRMLGPMERFLWAANFDDPTHFAIAAQIEGIASPEMWRTALDTVQRRHPLCTVCIARNANQMPAFHKVADASISLRIVQSDASQDWVAEMERELTEPFRSHHAPLLRAVLMHTPHHATLILVAHHSLADGLAIAFFLRDLLETLAGAPMPPLPLGRAQEELLGLISPAEEAANPASGTTPALGTQEVALRKGTSRPHLDPLRLTPELTAQLRTRARLEGTTLHGVLSAALVLAGRQISMEWRQRPVRVLSPIDLRKMLDPQEDCVLRVGVGLTALDPGEAPDFWELARLANRSLAEAQTRTGIEGGLNALNQALCDGPDLEVAAHLMANVFVHDILLTNLGSLRFETVFGAWKLEALWGPAVMGHGDRQTIGAVTIGGALHLLHTSHTPLPALLRTAEQILAAAC